MDFDAIRKKLKEQYGSCTETDVASYAMYPKVYEDYRKWTTKYGDLSVLPTKFFLAKPEIGEEFHVELEKGKVLILKLLAVGPISEQTGQREVFYEMNGEMRQVTVDDNLAAVENKSRPKADASDSSQVGAPMSGVVVEIRVKEGSEVNKGDPVAVLNAMKMVSHDIYGQVRLKLIFLTGNDHQCSTLWKDLWSRCQGGRFCRRTGFGVQDHQVGVILNSRCTHKSLSHERFRRSLIENPICLKYT